MLLSCILTIFKILWITPFAELTFESFTYLNLYSVSGIHPTYMGAYVFIAIVYFLFEFSDEVDRKKNTKFLIAAFLLFYCILLSSRAILLALMLFLAISFFLQKEKNKLILYLGLILIVGMGGAITFIPDLKDRFVDALSDMINFRNTSDTRASSADLHVKIWYCSLQQIDFAHFIQGYGTGDEKPVLSDCFLSHNWRVLYNMDIDSHNEYLSQIIRNGVVGLIFFLSGILLPIRQVIKQKDMIYLSLLVAIFVMSFFDSLGHLNGLIFYGFFNALFFKRVMENNKIEV